MLGRNAIYVRSDWFPDLSPGALVCICGAYAICTGDGAQSWLVPLQLQPVIADYR
jgi:hypothetical protein